MLENTLITACTKEGVKFHVTGDLEAAKALVQQNIMAEKDKEKVLIDREELVELTFALRYLPQLLHQGHGVGATVILNMSLEVPMVVEYSIGGRGTSSTIWHQRLTRTRAIRSSGTLVADVAGVHDPVNTYYDLISF